MDELTPGAWYRSVEEHPDFSSTDVAVLKAAHLRAASQWQSMPHDVRRNFSSAEFVGGASRHLQSAKDYALLEIAEKTVAALSARLVVDPVR